MNPPQRVEHRGVRRDPAGVLLVRGDVAARRHAPGGRDGGGGGREVIASATPLILFSEVRGHFRESGFICCVWGRWKRQIYQRGKK